MTKDFIEMVEKEFPGMSPKIAWQVICNARRSEGKKLRNSIINESSTCEICGFDFHKILQIHHIIPISLGGSNKKENIICVCPNCHKMLHFAYGIVQKGDEDANKELMKWMTDNFGDAEYALFMTFLLEFLMGTRHC